MATDLTTIGVGVDTRGLKKGQSEMERFGRTGTQTEKKVNRATDGMNSSFMSLKNTIGVVGTALAALGAQRLFSGVMRSFSEFERGLVGVGKTTDITGAELEALGGRIQGVSREVPIATGRLMELAQAAGQLGVRGSENITRFAKTLGQMELATDVVGEEGARSLARLLTVTGESMSEVDRLGSAITELGNSFAATEQEIVQTSTFLAPATQQYGLAASEVAGLSAALRALGQRAETSGSAIGAALAEIDTALAKGNEGLRTLVELTGQSATELEKAFRDNATGVLLDFGEALNQLPTAQQTAVLEQFNLAGRETRRVIGALASNTDLARKALEASGDEWERNMALTEEAAKAATTFSAQVQLMANAADEAAVEIGRMIAPSALSGIHGMRDAAIALSENMDTVTDIAAGLAAVVGGRLAGSFAASTKAFAGKTAAAIKDTQATYQQAQATKVSAAAEIEFLRVNQASLSAQLASAQGTARSAALRSQLAGNTAALTAATKTYNAALATTALRSRAASGAMSAMRGVMGVFGGPAGLFVTAATGAIFFKDELFNLIGVGRDAEKALDGVIESMKEMEKTSTQIALEESLKTAVEQLERLQHLRDTATKGAQLRSENDPYVKSLDRQIDATNSLIDRNEILLMSENRQRVELTNLAGVFADVTKATDKQNKASGELSETFTDDVIPAVEEAIEGYISLREQYDPIFAANRNLSRDLDQLNRDWQNGLYETRDAYESVREAIINDNLMIETSTRDTALTFTDEMGGSAKTLQNIWENTTRNIQSAMSDMFFDILDQGKVTFDGILDAFKRMAAEMMAQEIMLRFTGQGGGPISSLFSNVMGGGSGGGFDFGSLASAGGTLWNGISGLAGGEGLSGFTGLGGQIANGLGFGGGGLDSLLINAGTRSTTIGGGITGGGGGGFGSNLMGSMSSMWPLAVIAGMLQSGKLYDQGVRPDPDETFSSTQGNVIGQMGNVGPTLQSGVFESLDSILEPIFGGKGAAMLTGSTFHQELWNSINEGIFGSDYQATRGGIKLGMGTHNDFNPTAWVRESKKGGLFSSSSRRYKFSELDDDLREPLVDTYESTLDRVKAMYETIGIDVEEGVLRAVETADMLIGTSGKSEQTEEEIKKQIHEWFTQLSDDMSEAVLDGMSMAELEELAGAIAPLRRMMATSPVDQAREDYQAGQTTTIGSSYREATSQVQRLAEAYDGSVQSSRQLSSALQQQQESAYQLAMAYQQTSASVESLFGNLHEQIRTSLMSQEELYNYQRRQVHTLTDMLADMTDPERIMQTSERIENLVSSMWQPLNEEQRQKKGPQFLEYLEEVEQVAQERLQVGMDKIESNQNDINESIRQGINNAATVMQQAAQGQQEAANRNIEAANMMGMSAEQIAAAVANLQRSGGMEANG